MTALAKLSALFEETAAGGFKAGQKVMVKWREDGQYYPAKILGKGPKGGGQWRIQWDEPGWDPINTWDRNIKAVKGTKNKAPPPKAESSKGSIGFSGTVKNSMLKWGGYGGGKYSGNAGGFWLKISDQIPKEHRSPPKDEIYRGLQFNVANAIKVLTGSARPKKKDVESWTSDVRSAMGYADPDDIGVVGIVMKGSAKKKGSIAYLSDKFLAAAFGEDADMMVHQDEVVTKGSGKWDLKEVDHLVVGQDDAFKISKGLGIDPPKTSNSKNPSHKLLFKNGKPDKWVANDNGQKAHEYRKNKRK